MTDGNLTLMPRGTEDLNPPTRTASPSSTPIVDGYIGCIVIQPDGSRYLARIEPDPLTH